MGYANQPIESTDVLHDPKWLIANINARTDNGRRRPDKQAEEWMAQLDRLQSGGDGTPPSRNPQRREGTPSPVDSALNTWNWRDAIDKPAPTNQGGSKYEQQMGQLDDLLDNVLHGDNQQQSAKMVGYHWYAGTGGVSGGNDAGMNVFYNDGTRQWVPTSKPGEFPPTIPPNSPAPKEYKIDPQTGNYDTNVPGGSLQDAITKLSPGQGWDYNSSTGQWIAPGTAKPVIRTEAGGPNRASEFEYNRSIPTGQPTGDVPNISNPIPNGIDWPELPKTPGLPEPIKLAGNDRNDLNDMLNSSPETSFLAPGATPTPTPPPQPPPKKEEEYAA